MPAIRPHQKTRLHLRDSATVDFGPEGQTLTNNGVTVTNDEFTFDGSSHIEVGTSLVDVNAQDWTIKVWVKTPVSTGTTKTIYHETPTAGSTAATGVFLRIDSDGTLDLFYNAAGSGSYSSVSGTIRVDDNQQHLVVAKKVGDTVSLRLDYDAEIVTSTTTTSFAWTSCDLGVVGRDGRSDFLSSYFNGEMADLRVIAYGITDGEEFDLWNNGPGYDLPERRQLPDTVVHLLDGSTDAGFYGEETTLDSVAYENGVYTFSGTTPHIDFGQTRVFNESDGFAFACFFNAPDMSTQRFLWCHGTTTYVELNGVGSVRYKASDNTLRSRSFAFTAGQTYHLAISIEGSVASVYIDGVLDGTFATAGTSTFSFSQFSTSNASFEYLGDMWDNRVFDRPISAGEVANLYRKGIPSIRRAEVLRIDPARYSGSGDLIDQTGGGNNAELQGTAAVTGGVLVTDGSVHTYARTSAANLGLEKGTIVARMRLGVSGDDTEGTSFFWDCVDARIALFRDGASRNELRMFVNGRYRDFDPHEWDADTTFTVAMVYEKATDTLQLYWDGVAIAGEVALGTWGSTALGTFFTIGAAFNGTGNLTAEYDWLNVYDEVLTADQIAYLSAKGNADPFPVPFGNLGGETLSIQPSRYTGSGDLLDQSGNGNGLTLPSGYSVANSVISSDGTTDGPGFPGVDMSSSPGSIGFWIKTTDATVICVEGSNAGYCMSIQDNSNASAMNAVTNGQHYVDTVAIADNRDTLHAAISGGEWHHFAFTGDFNSNFGTVNLFGFGGSSGSRLIGEVDDIRIDNTRKWSAEEIKLLASARGVELPNTRDAKLAVLPSYDDASNGSTSTIDYSGNLNTGTISGGPTWNTTDNSESGTRSIESTGAGSVSFDDSGLPLGDSARSIVTWVRVDDYSNDTQWFEYGTDATGQRFGLGVRNTDWMVVTINGAAVGTQNTPAAGTWAPVIVTYAGDGAAIDTVTFYIDGVAYSASTQAGTGSNVPGTVSGTGALLASIVSGNIEAAIDDVLVYDRVLTPGEIARFSERRNIFGDAYIPPAPGSGGLIPIILF